MRLRLKGDCNNCPLNGSAKVYGEGPENADIMLIGQNPGYHECMVGRPFVGRSGQKLNEVLKKVGIKRENIYVTNACLCKTEGNEAPSSAVIECCRSRLIEEVKRISPKLIICLGTTAAKALLRSRSLKEARGKIYTFGSAKVYVTFHPANILRKWEYHPLFEKDIRKAMELLEGYEEERFRYEVVEGSEKVKEVCKYISESPVFSLDIETTGFDFLSSEVLCIQASREEGEAFCFPLLGYKGTEIYSKEEKREVLKHISGPLLSNSQKVLANAKFDLQFLHTLGLDVKGEIWDVMLMHHLINENLPHSLDELVIEYCSNSCTDKHLRITDLVHSYAPKLSDSFADVPRNALYFYACSDADCTLRVFKTLIQELEKENLVSFYKRLVLPLMIVLTSVEERGILIDKERMDKASVVLSKRIQEEEQKLFDLAGKKFNPRSIMQLRSVFAQLGLHTNKRTDKGNISLDKEVLEKLQAEHEFPRRLLELRKLQKLKSTYVDGASGNKGIRAFLRRDGRVHPSFLQHVTRTGRLSSSSPNFQNIPREPEEIREMFTTTPGWKFIEADLSKSELHVAAQVAQDKNLRIRLNGDDFHNYTARAVGICKKGSTPNKEQRNKSKCLIFGLIYGGSPASLASRLGVPVSVAEKYTEKLFETYPRLKEYMEAQRRRSLQPSFTLVNAFGRKRRFYNLDGDSSVVHRVARQAINFPIQSGSSDVLSLAVIRIFNRLKGFKAGIIGTIHDSVFVEAPDEEVEEVVKIIKEEMERYVPELDYCPKVDIKVSKRWGGPECPIGGNHE